jgi:uncharacterized protein YcfL
MNKLIILLLCSVAFTGCSSMQLKPTVGVTMGTSI